MQEAISSILSVARAPGILAPNPDGTKHYLAAGFTMVAVGPDLGLLARGADDLLARFR